MRPQPGSDMRIFAALAVGVIAVSTSGALIAYAAAPALAVAFWRNAMALPVLVPAAVVRRRHELRALLGPARREGVYCALAGVALAAHFGTWVPSTKLTSVATATALVATQPVWAGLIAVGQGRRLPGSTWAGIAVAVVGAALATGADIRAGGAALVGDLLALAGGLLAAIYTSLGERARATTSTTAYTAVCYTVCGVVLLGVCLLSPGSAHRLPGYRMGGVGGPDDRATVARALDVQLRPAPGVGDHGVGADTPRGARGRPARVGLARTGAPSGRAARVGAVACRSRDCGHGRTPASWRQGAGGARGRRDQPGLDRRSGRADIRAVRPFLTDQRPSRSRPRVRRTGRGRWLWGAPDATARPRSSHPA